jgi:hypothetical protein
MAGYPFSRTGETKRPLVSPHSVFTSQVKIRSGNGSELKSFLGQKRALAASRDVRSAPESRRSLWIGFVATRFNNRSRSAPGYVCVIPESDITQRGSEAAVNRRFANPMLWSGNMRSFSTT